MKGYAKFLRIVTGILSWIIMLAVVLLVLAAVVMFIGGSEIVESVVTILDDNGLPIGNVDLSAAGPVIGGAMAALALVALIGFIALRHIRTAFRETEEGRPFSAACSSALSKAGTCELVAGLLGIAASIALSFFIAEFIPEAGSSSSVTATANLSFIFMSVLLKMLGKVSEYGAAQQNAPYIG